MCRRRKSYFSIRSAVGADFGAVVNIPLGTPTFHIGVSGFECQLCFWFHLAGIATPGSSRWWLQYLGSCSAHRETQKEFPAWPKPGWCRHLENEPVGRRSLPASCLFLCLSSKMKINGSLKKRCSSVLLSKSWSLRTDEQICWVSCGQFLFVVWDSCTFKRNYWLTCFGCIL